MQTYDVRETNSDDVTAEVFFCEY